MKRRAGTGLALMLGMAAGAASAQYAIRNWTVESGGGRSQGGPYVVIGSIGQPEPDPLQSLKGGPYALVGGYWKPGATPPGGDRIFRSGFE